MFWNSFVHGNHYNDNCQHSSHSFFFLSRHWFRTEFRFSKRIICLYNDKQENTLLLLSPHTQNKKSGAPMPIRKQCRLFSFVCFYLENKIALKIVSVAFASCFVPHFDLFPFFSSLNRIKTMVFTCSVHEPWRRRRYTPLCSRPWAATTKIYIFLILSTTTTMREIKMN